MVFPFSVRWMICPSGQLPDGVRVQVLIATSKRKFRHAVDRNRVKRLTRECYRLRKGMLVDYLAAHDLSLLLSVNYVHNEVLAYELFSSKMDKMFTALVKALQVSSNANS